MEHSSKTLLLIPLFLLSFYSCRYFELKERKSEIEKSITEWYQKRINLPDSIFLDNNGVKIKILTKDHLNNGIKVLSVLNNECLNCTISQLKFWAEFYSNYKNSHNFQLILVYSGFNEYFYDNLLLETDVRLPILLDESDFLIRNNSLFKNQLYRTVLLDKENKIILIGDFQRNKNLENIYKEEIQKRIHYSKIY